MKNKNVNQTSVNSYFYWPEMLPGNSRVLPNHADYLYSDLTSGNKASHKKYGLLSFKPGIL